MYHHTQQSFIQNIYLIVGECGVYSIRTILSVMNRVTDFAVLITFGQIWADEKDEYKMYNINIESFLFALFHVYCVILCIDACFRWISVLSAFFSVDGFVKKSTPAYVGVIEIFLFLEMMCFLDELWKQSISYSTVIYITIYHWTRSKQFIFSIFGRIVNIDSKVFRAVYRIA